MKAIKFFALVAALLAVGCTNELMDDSIEQNKTPENGIILTLNGTAQSEASRIIVDGSKSNGEYIVKWRNDDAIGIFSADGTTINNVKAAETTISSGAHKTATFDTDTAVAAEFGDELYVYYPYNSAATLSGSKLSFNLPAEQVMDNRTVQYDWGNYAYSYDKTTVGENGNVDFTLEHPLAYVKVYVSVSEDFANHSLCGVELVDLNGVAKLSGDATIDMESGELSLTNTSSRVKLNVTHYTESALDKTYGYWLVTAPWDFAGSDVWVVLSLYNKTTKQVVYMPIKYNSPKLIGGAVNVINIDNLSAENNSASTWYEAIDSRLMPVTGYAYGEQNTYLIQCKNDSIYNGATYTPNDNIPNAVRVDIRGRGDFSKIADPRKATFEWAKNNADLTYTLDCRKYPHLDPTAYTIDDSTKAQGYITVTNTGAYAGSPILLMKIDGKVVWSWSFWNIAADGTKFEDVTIGNYTYANMPIGQASTQYTTWMANKRTGSSNTDFVGRTINVYQWGRPSPLFWQEDSAGNVDLLYQKSSTAAAPTIEEAIANPEIYYLPSTAGTSGIWSATVSNDLWGDVNKKGANESAERYKSVFDPCPKGYKVMDYKAMLDYVAQTYTVDETTGASGIVFGTHKFINSGYLYGNLTSGRSAAYGWSYAPTQGNTTYNMCWCNVSGNAQGYSAYYRYNNTALSKKQFNKRLAMPVRCQKDADNR